MKPHEEEWMMSTSGNIWLRKGGLVAEFDGPERATLAHAAPEMARALLQARSCKNPTGLCPKCTTTIDDALTKAGVLP